MKSITRTGGYDLPWRNRQAECTKRWHWRIL